VEVLEITVQFLLMANLNLFKIKENIHTPNSELGL
jgi:hypothetical protein